MTTTPRFIYHVATEKLARRYRETGAIKLPVRGFSTTMAAMAWAIKTGRRVIYEINVTDLPVHKLPDHHNAFGTAWWVDRDVPISRMSCFFSAEKDA